MNARFFLEKPWLMIWILRFWPPFFGQGIWVKKISPDYRFIEVELKSWFLTRNILGTQFGGALFAMCDPFFLLMWAYILGPKFHVIDQSSEIRFIKPASQSVIARFAITDAMIEDMRKKLETTPGQSVIFDGIVQLKTKTGDLIAHVTKKVSIREKL